MNNLLKVLNFFPYVFQGAQLLQTSLPDAPGTSKKDILLAVLQAGSAVGETVPEPHVQAISLMIDLIVSILKKKKIGAFAQAAAVTPAPPAPILAPAPILVPSVIIPVVHPVPVLAPVI